MIIQVTMKCPDALHEAAKEYANNALMLPENLTVFTHKYDCETEYFIQDKVDEFKDIASQWIENGEYVTLEINTELNTCKVV